MQRADTTRTKPLPLTCTVCGRGDDLARGWRLYVEPTALISFCPECAERELGEDER
jgi:hypothetical protein